MNFRPTLFVALLTITLSTWADTQSAALSINGAKKVSAEEVIVLASYDRALVLIDARKPNDRIASGWIQGSIALPAGRDSRWTLKNYVPNTDTAVVFYGRDAEHIRGRKAVRFALESGYKNVFWFPGGWNEWLSKGLPYVQ